MSRPIVVSLCERCRSMREIRSGKGSRFLLCELARAEPRFPKYPPQPVVQCSGYVDRGSVKEPRSAHVVES